MSIKISLNFVQGSINNTPALVQIIAWRCPCAKQLSEPIICWFHWVIYSSGMYTGKNADLWYQNRIPLIIYEEAASFQRIWPIYYHLHQLPLIQDNVMFYFEDYFSDTLFLLYIHASVHHWVIPFWPDNNPSKTGPEYLRDKFLHHCESIYT